MIETIQACVIINPHEKYITREIHWYGCGEKIRTTQFKETPTDINGTNITQKIISFLFLKTNEIKNKITDIITYPTRKLIR